MAVRVAQPAPSLQEEMVERGRRLGAGPWFRETIAWLISPTSGSAPKPSTNLLPFTNDWQWRTFASALAGTRDALGVQVLSESAAPELFGSAYVPFTAVDLLA